MAHTSGVHPVPPASSPTSPAPGGISPVSSRHGFWLRIHLGPTVPAAETFAANALSNGVMAATTVATAVSVEKGASTGVMSWGERLTGGLLSDATGLLDRVASLAGDPDAEFTRLREVLHEPLGVAL